MDEMDFPDLATCFLGSTTLSLSGQLLCQDTTQQSLWKKRGTAKQKTGNTFLFCVKFQVHCALWIRELHEVPTVVHCHWHRGISRLLCFFIWAHWQCGTSIHSRDLNFSNHQSSTNQSIFIKQQQQQKTWFKVNEISACHCCLITLKIGCVVGGGGEKMRGKK